MFVARSAACRATNESVFDAQGQGMVVVVVVVVELGSVRPSYTRDSKLIQRST